MGWKPGIGHARTRKQDGKDREAIHGSQVFCSRLAPCLVVSFEGSNATLRRPTVTGLGSTGSTRRRDPSLNDLAVKAEKKCRQASHATVERRSEAAMQTRRVASSRSSHRSKNKLTSHKIRSQGHLRPMRLHLGSQQLQVSITS